MVRRVPDALVVRTDVNDGAASDIEVPQILGSGLLFDAVSVARGGPGSAIKVALTVGLVFHRSVGGDGTVGDNKGNEWGDICVSCNSVL